MWRNHYEDLLDWSEDEFLIVLKELEDEWNVSLESERGAMASSDIGIIKNRISILREFDLDNIRPN